MDLNTLSASLEQQFRGLNDRYPCQWPIVPRVLRGRRIFLVLVVGWFFYWSDQQDELSAGEQKDVQLKEHYKSKIQQVINFGALRKQKEQVAEYVVTLAKQLASKAEMDALLYEHWFRWFGGVELVQCGSIQIHQHRIVFSGSRRTR